AKVAHPARAGAARRRRPATPAGFRGHSSTDSTSAYRSAGPTSTSSWAGRRANPRRPWPSGWPPCGRSSPSEVCAPTPRFRAGVARQLGRELAAHGVAIVSGLAIGIDGSAHEGALAAKAAPPVGVVGSGLDVVYPKRHRHLWDAVAAAGVLLSEAPMGAVPERWRFPARNRILAALSDVVVVVESHAAGGSMHTVRAAIDRGIPVMAVPGSMRNPAAAGTNQLLSEGVPPARDPDDIP